MTPPVGPVTGLTQVYLTLNRTGPPVDDEEDYGLPIWAGVVPLATTLDAPEPDPRLLPGLSAPQYLEHLASFGWRPAPAHERPAAA